jgi:hypothetical protein
MAAMLTFYPRRALLEATAAGLAFQVPIYKDAARATTWEHAYEFRPGKHTIWDHAHDLSGRDTDINAKVILRVAAGPAALEIHDYPGEYAQRFDGVNTGGSNARHPHTGPAVYVGTRSGGIYIHGWPVGNCKSCIIVLRDWDNLRRAIASERHLSFAIGT